MLHIKTNQRADYALKFNKLSVEVASKRKTTAVSNLPENEQPEFKDFSAYVASMLQSMTKWTDGLVDTLVQSAKALLNCKGVVQTCSFLRFAD